MTSSRDEGLLRRKSSRRKPHEDRQNRDNVELYATNFPLAESLLRERERRNLALRRAAKHTHLTVKSNKPWFRTVFVWRERAIDKFFLPWLFITLNAVVWTVLVEFVVDVEYDFSPGQYETVYALVLSTALAFLLVFRLNRVAVRWWDTRRMWGVLVEDARVLTSEALEHMDHAPDLRDRVIRWTGGFLVATKQFIRNDLSGLSEDEVSGFLGSEELGALRRSAHPGLHAATEIRHALKLAFRVTPETTAAMGASLSSEMRLMERTLNRIIGNAGGLERVKSTPLPIVYVTHLRTFLLFFLLSLPYMYAPSWRWGTIPAVAIMAYALLGIDAAAAECECPFDRTRANHLDMDTYCLVAMEDITQLVVHAAEIIMRESGDRPLEEKVTSNRELDMETIDGCTDSAV